MVRSSHLSATAFGREYSLIKIFYQHYSPCMNVFVDTESTIVRIFYGKDIFKLNIDFLIKIQNTKFIV